MSRRRGTWYGAVLLFGCMTPSRLARAEPLPVYELAYAADAGCPARVAFIGWVEAQLHDAREVTDGARARAAVYLQQGSPASGRLELTRDDGARYVRELGGETCEAAAQGLAFVLAYALGGGDPLDAPLPLARAPGATAHPVEPAPSPPGTAVHVSPAAPAATPAGQSSRWRFGFGVQLGARTGLGPTWTAVEAGFFDVRRRQAGLAPAVRVALLRGEPVRRVDASGTTELSWLAARLEGCPVQGQLLELLRVLPCVGVHLGRIHARGTPRGSAGKGQQANELWADAVAALRLELTVWRLLQLEAQGELLVPLTPYRFAFDNPDTPVYQVPAVAMAGFVGLGVHFP